MSRAREAEILRALADAIEAGQKVSTAYLLRVLADEVGLQAVDAVATATPKGKRPR